MIGEGRGAQLKVTKRLNDRSNCYYYSHDEIPSPAAPSNDKQPMPTMHISLIEDEIYKSSVYFDKKIGLNSSPDQIAYRSARQDYIYNRRIFTLWLMQFCGLRPEELEEMPLSQNRDPFKTSVIVLPTKKRRELPTPIRKLPLNTDDATELSSYIESRDNFVQLLVEQGRLKTDPDAMLLTENGAPISKQSLSRDFKRIAEKAGLTDVRICLSMFRHLFITRQMIYHIQSEINGATQASRDKSAADGIFYSLQKNQAFMIKICRKITPFTGHRNPASVIDYFHDAMRIVGKFIATDGDVKDINDMHSSMNSLVRIRHEAMRGHNAEFVKEIDNIRRKWELLRASGSRK